MTEMEPRPQANGAINGLLRSSMAAPVPSLPPDFERRVLRAVSRHSEQRDGYYRKLLTGYCLVSVLVSAAVMRSQGLPWYAVAVSLIAPLVMIVVVRSVRRETQAATSRRVG